MFKSNLKTLFTIILSILISGVFSVLPVSSFVSYAEEDSDYIFEMEKGAAIRVVEPYGIKFEVKIGKTLFKEQSGRFRILIVPNSYIKKYVRAEENIDYFKELSSNAPNIADMPASTELRADGYYYASGSLVGLLYKNLNRDFFGIAYYIDKGGIRHYANFDEGKNVRNIAQVANAAIAQDLSLFTDVQRNYLYETARRGDLLSMGYNETDTDSYLSYSNSGCYLDLISFDGKPKIVLNSADGVQIENMKFSSSNPEIAAVKDGIIYEKSKGYTILKCSHGGFNYEFLYVVAENSDFEFEVSDGYAEIKSLTNPDLTSVYIPSFYGTTPVRSISSAVFNGKSNITEVIMSDTIETIGQRAFRNCSSLSFVKFGHGSLLKSLGSRSFSGCTNLTEIILPPKTQIIDSNAFSGCSSLNKVYIPINVNYIGISAFKDCELSKVCFADKSGWYRCEETDGIESKVAINYNLIYTNAKEQLGVKTDETDEVNQNASNNYLRKI